VDEYFSIGISCEGVSVREIFSKLLVVVDLTVEDDGNRTVLVKNRLLSCFNTDNTEPTMGKSDWAILVVAGFIWPTMLKTIIHLFENAEVWRGNTRIDTRDATH